VKFSQMVKFLGVTLDRGFLFNAYTCDIVQRAKVAYAGITHFVQVDWGVSFWTGRLIYGATVESIVAYALSTFVHRVRASKKFKRTLCMVQRPALLVLCKAYRATSTEALCVLAGIFPLDYLVLMLAAMYKLSRAPPFSGALGSSGQVMVVVRGKSGPERSFASALPRSGTQSGKHPVRGVLHSPSCPPSGSD